MTLSVPSTPQLAGIVRGHAALYRRFGAAIAPAPPPAPCAAYERYLFALLSRHCALVRTVRAFQFLRGRYRSDAAEIGALLRSGRIGYQNTWPAQIAGTTMTSYHRWMEVTAIATLINAPALAAPAGFGPSGTPIGLQVIGRNHGERSLLEFARAWERRAGRS